MRGVNKFYGIGNLGQDPDVRYIPSGTAVAAFSVAINESWTDKSTGESKESTEWVSCECWGKLAEIAGQYLRKGSKVFVEGKLQTDKWDKDGVTHYKTKVRLDTFQMLDSKSQDGGQQRAPQQRPAAPQQTTAPEFDDDIPF